VIGPQRDAAFRELFIAPDSWQLSADPMAVRGSRLCLSHDRSRDVSEAGQPITVELLTVVTHITRGMSEDGFESEWHGVNVLTLDGELINRSERFNETDLDAALARFGELGRQAPEDPGHGQIFES
jgi:hypothetical protein